MIHAQWQMNHQLKHRWHYHGPEKFDHILALKWMLDNGADPSACADWDHTPLIEAIIFGSLLVENGADIRERQLLHAAAPRKLDGAVEIVNWLLALGLFIHAIRRSTSTGVWIVNSVHGEGTPLHVAVKCENAEVVRFLLLCGVDPHLPDILGVSARTLARNGGHVKIW